MEAVGSRIGAARTMDQDSRGILDPGRMRDAVRFGRAAPAGPLEGLVDFFWFVSWDLPPGRTFEQPVLTHPCANLSVGPASTRRAPGGTEASVVGVLRRVDRRFLSGTGTNVAAKLSCGALGAFAPCSAAQLTGRIVPMGDLLEMDAAGLIAAVDARRGDEEGQVDVIAVAYGDVAERAPAVRLAAARECVAIASLAEYDRALTTTRDLARAAGTSSRTLQRLFRDYVGVSPLWVLRRYRLIEAAERARAGGPVAWADLAHELGYADQSHLTRDFTATVGVSPASYARSVTPLPGQSARPRPG